MEIKSKKTDVILNNLIERFPQLDETKVQIKTAFDMLVNMYQKKGCLYIAGNGGSASDSEHIVGELMKSFMCSRKVEGKFKTQLENLYGYTGIKLAELLEEGLPAVSLPSLVSLSTAISNDTSGEIVFAQMVYSIANKGDIFLGLSTSGNSKNILNAMMVSKAKGINCIGLTGKNQCAFDELCDVVIHVPETETYKVQELHLPIYHALCSMLESFFFL